MRTRIMGWAAAGILSALLVADAGDASACGRRSRGGGGGGGSCGGGGGGAAFYGGGCAGGSGFGYGGYAYGAGYSFNPPSAGWEWGAASAPAWNAPAWGAPAWGAPAFQAPTLMPAATFPTGGASAAIAADRARRGSAVYALDPATGVLRQVGWLGADGTLRTLNDAAGHAPGALPPK